MNKTKREKDIQSDIEMIEEFKTIITKIKNGEPLPEWASKKFQGGSGILKLTKTVEFLEKELNRKINPTPLRQFECPTCGRIKIIPCHIDVIKCSDCGMDMVCLEEEIF